MRKVTLKEYMEDINDFLNAVGEDSTVKPESYWVGLYFDTKGNSELAVDIFMDTHIQTVTICQ